MQGFGAPKSLGAIYGVLFASEEPLAFHQIVEKLDMSAGSVSQGLKLLKNVGAVRSVFIPGERRDFFIAETQLRKLAGGFLRHRLDPQLASTDTRLNALMQDQENTGHTLSPFLQDRINILERWQTQAKGVLPLLLASLEAPAD